MKNVSKFLDWSRGLEQNTCRNKILVVLLKNKNLLFTESGIQ